MSFHQLFLVDDQPLIQSAMRELLDDQPDLALCGVASSVSDAISAIDVASPDAMIIDLSLGSPNGVSLLNTLRAEFPSLPIIVFTAREEPGHVREALVAGAQAYVTKRSTPEELLQAIREVLSGGSYVEPRIATRLIVPTGMGRCDPDVLSHRELSVLKMVAQGYCNKEISGRLNVSIKTVETYRVRAVDKLELRNRPALIRFAHVNGWLAELQ